MKSLDITDVISIAQFVQNQKGKYAKQALATIEDGGKLDTATRKAVLDNFNNYARALCRAFGYTIEE